MVGVGEVPHYAFPHAAEEESRRLELFKQRLDPLTISRLERLGIAPPTAWRSAAGVVRSLVGWPNALALTAM
jgi:hypothetical protein